MSTIHMQPSSNAGLGVVFLQRSSVTGLGCIDSGSGTICISSHLAVCKYMRVLICRKARPDLWRLSLCNRATSVMQLHMVSANFMMRCDCLENAELGFEITMNATPRIAGAARGHDTCSGCRGSRRINWCCSL